MSELTYGSLFAGVGGFDLGFDSAGWQCRFQVEWDKNCQEVLKRNWPDVPKFLDVRNVNGAELPPVDLISFGSPCQDLSVAGKRSGLDGDRSGLFFEGIRIIKEMRDATNGQYPKWAIWENVPGALTSNKGEDFGEVLDQMANIGALAIEWHILDAQWFGVAQRRRRVFVIASWDSSAIERSGSQILPVPENSKGNSSKGRKERKQGSGTVEASASESIQDDRLEVVEPYVKVIRSGARDKDGNLPPEVWRNEPVAPTLNAFDNSGESRSTVLIVDGTRVNDVRIYDNGIVPTLKHRMGTGGGQVPLVSGYGNIAYAYDAYNNKITENKYRTLRTGVDSGDHIMAPVDKQYSSHIKQDSTSESDLSICITEQIGVGVNQNEGDDFILRRLTPLECERLMGFPDNHTAMDSNGKKIADTNRYKMCGNAIASPVAEWIGKELKRCISQK